MVTICKRLCRRRAERASESCSRGMCRTDPGSSARQPASQIGLDICAPYLGGHPLADYDGQQNDGEDRRDLPRGKHVERRLQFGIDVEYALEQPCPAHPHRVAVCVLVGRGAVLLRRLGHDRGMPLRIRGEHPKKADQVQPRAWHQRGQALQELRRRPTHVGADGI